jgi:tRNA(adenine34) deaminase
MAAAVDTRSGQEWREAMHAALAEAALARGAGDVPVGAVLLDAEGAVLATGRNRREEDRDPTAHAEVVAIRRGAEVRGDWHLDDCTLVVTLEPCAMCAGAIYWAGIGRLVYGAADPKAGACGSVLDLSADARLNHRFAVEGGVRGGACGALLTEFFRARREEGPRER